MIRSAIRYSRARRALSLNEMRGFAAGEVAETPEFLRLNRAVADAEEGVPWWLQELIDRWVLWRVGYWDVVTTDLPGAHEGARASERE